MVADKAQQTTKVIEDAKPIASSTVETISSADPVVIVGTAGALFLTYLLLPPIWSAISFSLRGYKGDSILLSYRMAFSNWKRTIELKEQMMLEVIIYKARPQDKNYIR